MTPIKAGEPLNGTDVRALFVSALQALSSASRAVDSINVYPVPDGDTGANMTATLREAVERAVSLEGDPAVPDVLEAIARGALYGARGNSGVILSQALRGFAAGIGQNAAVDGALLARGLEQASLQAYRAVSKPQEGTMLTVLRVASEAARETASPVAGGSCAPVLAAACRAADAAEALTQEQLPALREAGVPDAGGEGICVILRGLMAGITGQAVPEPPVALKPIAGRAGHEGEAFGFCTEFLIEPDGKPLDLATVRSLAEAGNRSVVVVGDETLVRVHAHSENPDALLQSAGKLGRLARVKVEDMSAQNERFAASGSGAGAKAGLLALSRGAGFDGIFRGLGAAVTDLGAVEKPPAGEIAEAADALRIADTIVLANHPNVILAAEQARALARATLHVVPTRTLPQGIAAAMAFDPQDPVSANLDAMREAITAVRTIEVTTAAVSRSADGVSVKAGQAIALVDGRLALAAPSHEQALLLAVNEVQPAAGALLTIYGGEDVDDAELERAAGMLREAFAEVDVEALSGGQPLYPFIASIE
jgi:DAK2 domain fusion protein YloV